MHGDAFAHIKACKQNPRQPCILNCGSAQLMRGKKEMSEHLLQSCCKMLLICLKCTEKELRKNIPLHACKEDPNEAVKRLEQKVISLEKLNQA